MTTITLPIGKIRLNDDNPRLIRDARFAQLVKSLQEFPEMLALRPLVVDESYTVLGGNMRLRAMLHLHYTEALVTVAEGLSEAQKREFVIKDNGSFGEHDWDALANGDWPDAVTLNDWGMSLPAHWGQDVDGVNEQEEWMGMPAFEKEGEGFKIVINCLTEADRQAAAAAYGLTFTKQMGTAWSCHYPPKERGDLVSLKYE